MKIIHASDIHACKEHEAEVMTSLREIKEARRNNAADLVVYHGDVAGTSLQNDQTVERGTGIAITIDDLASIGADYAALGHIHKPQQVETLPVESRVKEYKRERGKA